MAALTPAPAGADDETIAARLRAGREFVERGAGYRDRIACRRFLDGSEAAVDVQHDDLLLDTVGVLPLSQEVGNVNYLMINLQTKVASLAIGDPDWMVTAADDATAETVRRFLRGLWKRRAWARACRKALLKRCISGLGVVAWLWDAQAGPVLEHVRITDLAVDPHVTDWRSLRWAARRIRLPREEAERRWPAAVFDRTDTLPADAEYGLSAGTVELWIYWDAEAEAVLHGGDVIDRGPNLYGEVPLLVLEGDIAPESEFCLGDYDLATGLQAMLGRLQSIINNQAENGGAILWYNPGLLTDDAKEAFASGRPQGAIPISASADSAFGFKSGEPVSAAVLEAFRIAQTGLDSVTGVSEYQRGAIANSVKFATEAALLANQSGSRANQARIEYEQFLDRAGAAVLEMVRRFGLALAVDGGLADLAVLDALGRVDDLAVVEHSTSYRDPAWEISRAVQLSQALGPYVAAGVVNPQPLVRLLLQAFGERDDRAWLNPSPLAVAPIVAALAAHHPPASGQPAAKGA